MTGEFQAPPQANPGWFKASRGQDALELVKANPLALVLAYVIAHRARWRDGYNCHGLGPGEAMLGDFQNYGMTRQQYRTCVQQLAKWKFATFRATNAGTIGKLLDSRLFSVHADANHQPSNQRATNGQPTANQRATTNEEGKNIRTEDIGAVASSA